jgi:alpha-glucoside transport system substrate-binding protein
MTLRRKAAGTAGLVVLAVAAATACTSSAGHAPTAPPSSAIRSGAAPGSVRVLGLWSGPEYDSFATVKAAWEKETGGSVDWQSSQDLTGTLGDDEQAGHPPDIAILPNLGLLRQLAGQGKLVPLGSVLNMTRVHRDYAPAWTDLGSYRGKLYGFFYKTADKATVWYDPNAFKAAGYRVPKTWDDLTALADKIVADGHTPFSVAAATGPASGWALTDWVAEIVLAKCGPDRYDRWIAAAIPWTDACINQSFEMFDRLVRTKQYVLGGSQRILSTTDAAGSYPMYTTPPDAYMYYLASFAQGFITTQYPNLTAGTDYGFFPFPTIDPEYRGAITVGADIVVMMHDTPAARSFLTYLAGARAQETWVKIGAFTSVNRSVPLRSYPDPVERAVAAQLTGAPIVRYSAGDSMPPTVQKAWWAAMLELVNNPGKLDSILDSMTRLARSAR